MSIFPRRLPLNKQKSVSLVIISLRPTSQHLIDRSIKFFYSPQKSFLKHVSIPVYLIIYFNISLCSGSKKKRMLFKNHILA